MRSFVHEPVVPARLAESPMAVAAESTRPAALSVRAAAVSAALSALLHAPSAATHSAREVVIRSAWPVMIRLQFLGCLPVAAGARRRDANGGRDVGRSGKG